PGYRANMEAPLIMPGTYRIIDLDKSKITSLKDLKMDVEAGRQKDSRYIGLNFEHLYGSTYDVQNMSPVISPRYGKQLSGDLRRRCWKVRRTPQFYHLANPVGQMKSVSEAFPEDLSYATLGTTVVCQDDDNTISLGLCKVLGFRKAEYEESDYIFVTLTRWNGGTLPLTEKSGDYRAPLSALPLTEKNGHYRALPSAHLLTEKNGNYRAPLSALPLTEKNGHYRALPSAHLLNEEEGHYGALRSAHLLGPLMPLEPLVPQQADTPQRAEGGKLMAILSSPSSDQNHLTLTYHSKSTPRRTKLIPQRRRRPHTPLGAENNK
ncbi:hypothetical protein FOZ60_011568, partial [Perkinsus olseni]